MIPTGHWNRIDKMVKKLGSRKVLDQAKRKFDETRKLYQLRVGAYIAHGGRINQNRHRVFQFIVDRSLIEIQGKLDTLNHISSPN
jgi:hypothetical protein